MMKLRNFGIVMISLVILLGSCFTAAATSVSDGTGDVWHYSYAGTAWSWAGNIANKPNIDITEISYTVNDNKITLKLEVSGTIQTSEKVGYYLWYNSTDTIYVMTYMNGTGAGYGMKGVMNFTSGNVTVSGDTLSVVLDVLGDTSKVELWGYAVEYTTFGDQTAEWWGDWAPNSKLPFTPGTGGTTDGNTTDGNNTNGNNTGTKTPGFEVIPVIAAVAIAAILLRRRR
ncbi:MAG TPA: Heimdall-CTERM domain-containing surface protein [Candidatus Thermoplasmatota archaeon]|nr:Heimdall-CTERM domain-containing surface protein [Candidatus Thermoplasmatota archaeon]